MILFSDIIIHRVQTEQPMNCIKCQSSLEKVTAGGLNFIYCPKCGAVILSRDTLLKIPEMIKLKTSYIDVFDLPVIKVKEKPRNCSFCNNVMEKVYFNGVVIDRCSACSVACFENGELSRFFNALSEEPIEVISNAQFIKKYCVQKESVENMKNNNTKSTSGIKIQTKEKEFTAAHISGWFMIPVIAILLSIAIVTLFQPFSILFSFIIFGLIIFLLKGFKIIYPQEAIALILFGKYTGTLRTPGFYWVNPFASSYNGICFGPISLKARTLENGRQKINDELGNPIEVGIIVVWAVKDTAKAIFNVDNYESFLSAQSDCALRNIVRMYPYDVADDSSKQSLRGDSVEISEKLKREIQNSVVDAGIDIIEARITHLAYSTEIAAAMLQRQQANAIIDAKRAIVEGAVGMVEMALDKLEQNGKLVLDNNAKANMINNLLVVLCANKESQPVIRNDIV